MTQDGRRCQDPDQLHPEEFGKPPGSAETGFLEIWASPAAITKDQEDRAIQAPEASQAGPCSLGVAAAHGRGHGSGLCLAV